MSERRSGGKARRSRSVAICAIAMVLVVASAAAIAADPKRNAEVAQIRSERQAAESTYAKREAECRQRFVVSACLADAKHDRRAALDALRDRQLVIDEATRRERAAARRSELAVKASEDLRRDAARAAKAASASAAGRAPATGAAADDPAAPDEPRANTGREASASSPKPLRAHAPPAPRPSAEPAVRADHEQVKRDAFAARRDEAARHRDDVARRNAAREGHSRAPLPVSSPAASPSLPKRSVSSPR